MDSAVGKSSIDPIDLTDLTDESDDEAEPLRVGQLSAKTTKRLNYYLGEWKAKVQPASLTRKLKVEPPQTPISGSSKTQPTVSTAENSVAQERNSASVAPHHEPTWKINGASHVPGAQEQSTRQVEQPAATKQPSTATSTASTEKKGTATDNTANHPAVAAGRPASKSRTSTPAGKAPKTIQQRPGSEIFPITTAKSQKPFKSESEIPIQKEASLERGMKRDSNGDPVKPPRLVLRMPSTSSQYVEDQMPTSDVSNTETSKTTTVRRSATTGGDGFPTTPQPQSVSQPGSKATFAVKQSTVKKTSEFASIRARTALLMGNEKTVRLVAAMDATYIDKGAPVTPEEDELIVHLKEELKQSWSDIGKFFQHRGGWHSAQSRYSTKLKNRNKHTIVTTPPAIAQDAEEDSSQRSLRANHPVNYSIRPPSPANGREISSDYGSVQPELESEARNDSDEEIHQQFAVARRRQPIRDAEPLMTSIENASVVTQASRSKKQDPTQKHLRIQRDLAALRSVTSKILRPPKFIKTIGLDGTQEVREQKQSSVEFPRPYLYHKERQFLDKSVTKGLWNDSQGLLWDGTVVHVDFTEEEIEQIEWILRDRGREASTSIGAFGGITLREIMSNATNSDIQRFALRCQRKGLLLNRSERSIEGFLFDVKFNKANYLPLVKILKAQQDQRKQTMPLRKNLLSRELGAKRNTQSYAGGIMRNIQDTAYNTIGPLMSFAGTSGAVNAVSWSPDGKHFAVGSAALTDTDSMQYNMPKNLLLGDITKGRLRELPSHVTLRQRPEKGPNSSHLMHASQDPLLFQTITSVKFTADNQALLSAGYDGCVRQWDISQGIDWERNVPEISFRHKGEVDVLAVNQRGIFATGSKRISQGDDSRAVCPIRVFKYDPYENDLTNLKVHALSSPRANEKKSDHVVPSCLVWGAHFYQQEKYLLAGFTSNSKDYGYGQVCLWDVDAEAPVAIERGNRDVFDVAWDPNTFGRFAVASSPSSKMNQGMRSVVRLYDSTRLLSASAPLRVNTHRTIEFECPALDINDIVFNSKDVNLVSAGCTNGSIYTWDTRMPDSILHRFTHGDSLAPLDHGVAREEIDDGVRFVSWDHSGRRMYTGSSDGIVALWNPYISAEDAHIRNVASMKSGVLSAAFSPDFDKLLLGEVSGRVSVLSIGRDNHDDFENFSFNPKVTMTVEEHKERTRQKFGVLSTAAERNREEGQLAGHEMLESQQIVLQPLGDFRRYNSQTSQNQRVKQAVQGPNYRGPFDLRPDAPLLRTASATFQSRMKTRRGTQSAESTSFAGDGNTFNFEDTCDSREWKKRIPETFRFPASKAVMDSKDLPVLYCYGHKGVPRVKCEQNDDEDFLRCPVCKKTWRMDILGYTLMNQDRQPLTPNNESDYLEIMQLGQALAKEDERKKDKDAESKGNCQGYPMETHYQDLWEIPPTSLL